MRIVLSDFMSLDGVVQAPGGREEDTDGGFAHGGWSIPFFEPETMGPAVNDVMAGTEALLFGRRTWQAMAAAWPGRRPVRRPDESDPQVRGVPNADSRRSHLARFDAAARPRCDRRDPGAARA